MTESRIKKFPNNMENGIWIIKIIYSKNGIWIIKITYSKNGYIDIWLVTFSK